MVRAMVFDLDGTLVQTETLKAISYARAAIALCPQEISEEMVVEAFKDVVGLSRREVSQALVSRFNLEESARARMGDFGVSAPWQAFAQMRLQVYDEMLEDPQIIRDHVCPHNVALLAYARESACKIGLATMSRCQQASRVLEVLNLMDAFDFVATRDDVTRGKPDPEIYRLVSDELQVPAHECLVIEDSPSGIEAALAAEMHCIAVTSAFTRSAVHNSGMLDEAWIVDDPARLLAVVEMKLAEVGRRIT